ncbi:hypothetical protein [Motiliproteus sp. SC1-56]|uniref:hypothetical protein n=1 Tax=Motiliproteus sp. SC1-56 TaxID=2799565 RepID=UPI001A8DCDE1|nr:hypothetical protein [Motiliproteus sp. SC1-56]
MKAKLLALAERFDGLTLRERLLILITLVVALVLPTFLYLIEPAQKAKAGVERRAVQLEAELANKKLELVTLKSRPLVDPNDALRSQLAALQAREKALDATLLERSARLISPQEMLEVLQAALAEQAGLTLISARKGDAEQVAEGPEGAPLKGVYRHDLTLVVAGGYFDVLAYVRALESLPRRFFWDAIDYQVRDYPRAEVTLKLHTLSTEKGWLGV